MVFIFSFFDSFLKDRHRILHTVFMTWGVLMNVGCKANTNLGIFVVLCLGEWVCLFFVVGLFLFGFVCIFFGSCLGFKLTWVGLQWQTEKNVYVLWDSIVIIHGRARSVLGWHSSG